MFPGLGYFSPARPPMTATVTMGPCSRLAPASLLSPSPCPAVGGETQATGSLRTGVRMCSPLPLPLLLPMEPDLFPQLAPFSLPKHVPRASSPGGCPARSSSQSSPLLHLLSPELSRSLPLASTPRPCPKACRLAEAGPLGSQEGAILQRVEWPGRTPSEGKRVSEVCEQGGGLGRASHLQTHLPNRLGRERETEPGQRGGLGRLPLAFPLLAWDPHQESLGRSAGAGPAHTPGQMLG